MPTRGWQSELDHRAWPPQSHAENLTTNGSTLNVCQFQSRRVTPLAESIRGPRAIEFKRRTARSPIVKLGRLMALIGRKVVRVEPMDWHKRQAGARVLSRTNLPPDAGYPHWSLVNLVLVVISMLHVAFNMYHQYKLDFNLFRVNHLLRAHRPHESSNSSSFSFSSTIDELQTVVRHHHRVLSISGAPATHLSFAIEVLYWIQILVPTIPYILPQFYIPPIKDCNVYAASILIDYEHHLVVCQYHIQEQVGRFLASSHNFQRILASKLARLRSPAAATAATVDICDRGPNKTGAEHQAAGPLAIKRMIMSSLDLERELARLAASDKLMPANSSPQQIFTWLPPLIVFMATCVVYGFAFDVYFMYMLFYSAGLSTPQAPPGDGLEWRPQQVNYSAAYTALASFESLILMVQLNCSSIYHGCTFLGTVIDMKNSANHLRARVENFVRDHDVRLPVDQAGGGERDRGAAAITVREANVQLLELFMHYRVFVRQFKAQQRHYTNFMWTCVSITMAVPLISRLHVPYFDANQEAKTFFIVLSFFIVTPATACLIPPCNMHRRCQDLTKSLQYLCAHIIRVGQQQRATPGGGDSINQRLREPPSLYDEHLVSALRREVGLNSCELRDRFTIRLGMASLCYTTLLEFYFWFGLAIVSIVARSSSSSSNLGMGSGDDHLHQSLGGLFNDPFGVYS